jgi:hypothetical protein
MPIDPSIYQNVGRTNPAMELAGMVNQYADQRTRLSQLARQNELQDFQLRAAQRAEAAIPQQQADAIRQRESQYMQGVSREIAQAPENADAILQKHAGLAPQLGIDPTHITWLASDLLNNANNISDIRSRAMYHANPQEAEKAFFAQQKPTTPSPVAQMIKDYEAATGEKMPIQEQARLYKQGLETKTTPQPFMQALTGEGGVQMLVTAPKSGGGRATVQNLGITKPGTEKPLTQDQANALAYGTRMLDSNKILEQVGTNFSPLKINTAASVENIPGLSTLGNMSLSENEQSVAQAQRNFINAALRRESGASISPSEFTSAKKQYFPQPGDGPAVIKQKEANRARAINSFKIAAGSAGDKFNAPVENITGVAQPQDNEAVTWAKSNLNDPRSAAILKINGVQ